MKKYFQLSFTIMAACLLLVGCGGSGDKNHAPDDSVTPSTKAGALRLCRELDLNFEMLEPMFNKYSEVYGPLEAQSNDESTKSVMKGFALSVAFKEVDPRIADYLMHPEIVAWFFTTLPVPVGNSFVFMNNHTLEALMDCRL